MEPCLAPPGSSVQHATLGDELWATLSSCSSFDSTHPWYRKKRGHRGGTRQRGGKAHWRKVLQAQADRRSKHAAAKEQLDQELDDFIVVKQLDDSLRSLAKRLANEERADAAAALDFNDDDRDDDFSAANAEPATSPPATPPPYAVLCVTHVFTRRPCPIRSTICRRSLFFDITKLKYA
jgi:hypothetical protein